MNLVILIDSARIFFRNFGLRHVNAALSLAIGPAAPNAGQKIIARFARPVEWLRDVRLSCAARGPSGSRSVFRRFPFRHAGPPSGGVSAAEPAYPSRCGPQTETLYESIRCRRYGPLSTPDSAETSTTNNS